MILLIFFGSSRIDCISSISPCSWPVSSVRLRMYSLVDVPQLDLRHIFGLRFVDAEGDHQVGYDLLLRLGLADNLDGLVDVQQNLFEAQQQVELSFFLFRSK